MLGFPTPPRPISRAPLHHVRLKQDPFQVPPTARCPLYLIPPQPGLVWGESGSPPFRGGRPSPLHPLGRFLLLGKPA